MSFTNTCTGIIVVLLPLRTISNLNLPSSQRAVVYFLIVVGLVVSFVGAGGSFFTYIYSLNPLDDLTWAGYWFIALGAVELLVGIICASVPSTKPFFVRHVPRFIGAFSSQRGIEKLRLLNARNLNKPDNTTSGTIVIVDDTQARPLCGSDVSPGTSTIKPLPVLPRDSSESFDRLNSMLIGPHDPRRPLSTRHHRYSYVPSKWAMPAPP